LVITQSPVAGTPAAVGTHPITVTVKDAAGNVATGFLNFRVVDVTAPVFVSGPASVTVSVDGTCNAVVPDLHSSFVAADNCTPANLVVIGQTPSAGTPVSKGTYSVTVTATDAAGNTSSRPVTLNVIDTTAPVITSVAVSPNTISPPNHQMVPVTVTVNATDNCDAPVSQIVSITCNESVAAGEIQITGALTASLAATRDAKGTGRVYTITVRSSDASGNSATATVTVTVPKGNK
jgi:hypothetical protein